MSNTDGELGYVGTTDIMRGDALSHGICRVGIYADWQSSRTTSDFALPATLPIGSLIPLVVDAIGSPDSDEPTVWQLHRLGGPALDEASTLGENRIEDGDLLVLASRDAAPLTPPTQEVTEPVRTTSVPSGEHPSHLDRMGYLFVVVWAAAGAAVAFTGPTAGSSVAGLVTAAVLTCAALAGAVLSPRMVGAASTLTTGLGIVAVMMAGTAGYLAVPGNPSAESFLLAAAAGGAAAVVLLRLTAGDAVTMTAAAAFSALLATTLAATSMWAVSTEVTGAVLTFAAVVTVSAAPRFSIAAAGLSPRIDLPENGVDEDTTDMRRRMVLGNRILSGLTVGACGATALGAALVALGSRHNPTVWSVAFTGAVGLSLALRGRSHVDPLRRLVLETTGIGAVSAAVALVLAALPSASIPVGVIAISGAVAVLWPISWKSASPQVLRAVDLVEYLAITATAPLACGVVGLYGWVRSLGLP